MKKQGSNTEYKHEREAAIMDAYRRLVAASQYIYVKNIIDDVVKQPCRRFWVSEERASIVISGMINGRPVLEGMNHQKRRMFTEIFCRVKILRQLRPFSSLISLIREVIEGPAPEFYMSPRYAHNIICSQRCKLMRS